MASQEDAMAQDQLAALLNRVGGWDDFEVQAIRQEDTVAPDVLGLPSFRLVIELRALEVAPKRCSGCGEVVQGIHDVSERRVRDLPIWDRDTWLVFPRARLRCPRCGPTVEEVPWLDRYQRMTKRLAAKIAALATILPIKHVAEWFGVGWDTVRQIDQRALERRVGPIDLRGVRRIAIDEFALHKGQVYATLVLDADTKRVLWVGRGRSGEHLRPFFTQLGPDGCAALEAVVMDLFPAHVKEVRAHCPQAAIVADLFHIIARFGADVIDRVRVDEMNRVGQAIRKGRSGYWRRVQARRPFWRARWLLLRNRQRLDPADQVRLQELLDANRALFTVYVLKEDLKELWHLRDPGAARVAWEGWYQRALTSGIKPLIQFAQRLARSIQYVFNHALFPLHTSLVEGINNKIKVLKRMAYGYRNDDYFFLKIRAAFPGITR
jgi:transposase